MRNKAMVTREKLFKDVEQHLGLPSCRTDKVLIYHGDCQQLMSMLPDSLIDLTVTSPPYNIGKSYETVKPIQEYIAWTAQWTTEVYRLTRTDGAFWLNLGYVSVSNRAKAIPLPYLIWNLVPFYFLQEIVWNYGAGVASKHSFSPRNEKFLWYVRSANDYCFNLDLVRDPNVKYPNQKKNGKLKCNVLGKNPTDVWQIPKVTSGTNRASKERTPHPAQFPEALIERIILACSDEGDIILDPFMGSGTTAVVASRLGRRCIGFEIREDYVQLASRRLNIDCTELTSLQEQSNQLATVDLFTEGGLLS